MIDQKNYSGKPLVLDAAKAHAKGWIKYEADGTVLLKTKRFDKEIRIDPEHQYPSIMVLYEDLSKALSAVSNSPRNAKGKSLRELFEAEFELYQNLVEKTQDSGGWEPDYGTYVYDEIAGELHLIAPEKWYRLGLVTNTAKLVSSPDNSKTWAQIRDVFDGKVIGCLGASVGGNVLEGVLREIRPRFIKLADPDWIEVTNFNRFERSHLKQLTQSRGKRRDKKNPYEIIRVNKAETTAYMQQMVDPYSQWYVYAEGIHAENIETFLIGDSNGEPKLDLLIEEIDDLRMKVEVRTLCKKHGIPVLMMSDFGHIIQAQFQDFAQINEDIPIGYKKDDAAVYKNLEIAMSGGKREDRFDFITTLCGPEYNRDEFGDWVEGLGEQPTSSIPQSGATAMISGGLAGKLVSRYFLGYKIPERIVLDVKRLELTE